MKSPLEDYHRNAASIQQGETAPLLSPEQYQCLLQNGRNPEQDHFPVVYLHMPQGGIQWLLSAVDPKDPAVAFGLCDLGFGVPELETVSFVEINLISSELVRPIECVQDFKPLYPISVYARAARLVAKITFDSRLLGLSVNWNYDFTGSPKTPRP